MAFQVDFYSFAKEENSTARPGGDPVRSLSCNLYTPCSIVRPVLEIAADVKDCNYCYIANFGRYYHIIDITYNNGVWLVSCRVDVLATYKNEIGGTPLYILRSAATGDGYITDTYAPATTEVTKYYDVLTGEANHAFNDGIFVVQIAGKQAGSSTLYRFTPSQFSTFLDSLLGLYDSFNWTGVEQSIKNSLFQPMNYIYSVRWYPPKNAGGNMFSGTVVSPVYVGYWNSGASGIQISDPFDVLKTETITLHDHPQAAARGLYLNAEPYRHMELYLPPFGIIPINSDKLVDAASIYISVQVDALTGAGYAYGRDDSGNKIFSASAQIGIDLPITTGNGGAGNVVSSLFTVAGGAAAAIMTGGLSAAGVVANGISSASKLLDTAPSTTGSQGSISAYRSGYASLSTYCRMVTDIDWTRNGRPLCQVATPSSLGGYMTVQRGDVPTTGTAEENTAIKTYLERGFYYE